MAAVIDLWRLRAKLVKELSSLRPGQDRQRRFAKYNDQVVLLDPKNYGEHANDRAGEKVIGRVNDLAKTLWEITDLDAFRTLPCQGWFEDDAKNQFYFVYRLLPVPNDPPTLQLDTLLEHVNSPLKPSITARIRLAHALALSLQKFHQMGWLHKGIHSEHVIFFRPNDGYPRSVDDPRLLGFDFSRRNGGDEFSEKAMNMSTNLYRHPDALRNPDIRFKAVHDYYSLGIVLVEIAKWQSMKTISSHDQTFHGQTGPDREIKPKDARQVRDMLLNRDSQEDHLRDIEFRMGEIYCKVVETCLTGRFGESGEDLEALREFGSRVVNELGRCVI